MKRAWGFLSGTARKGGSGEAASCSVASHKGEEPREQRCWCKAFKQWGESCGAADNLRASALVIMIQKLLETVSLTHRTTGASSYCQVCTWQLPLLTGPEVDTSSKRANQIPFPEPEPRNSGRARCDSLLSALQAVREPFPPRDEGKEQAGGRAGGRGHTGGGWAVPDQVARGSPQLSFPILSSPWVSGDSLTP